MQSYCIGCNVRSRVVQDWDSKDVMSGSQCFGWSRQH